MKVIYFVLFLWAIFALLDPDPNCESGSGDPMESASNPDLDPPHSTKNSFVVRSSVPASIEPSTSFMDLKPVGSRTWSGHEA